MSPFEPDADTTTEDDGGDTRRCTALELATGEVLLYRPGNHRAWIQSDVAVMLDDRL